MVFKNRIVALVALGMVLGIHRGYIALWQSGSAQPAQVYPYKMCLLPPEDQARLSEGIPVQNEAHLQSLLKDYLS